MQRLNQRFNSLVLDEDVDLVDNVQRGLATRGYSCGPLSAREAAVAWLADRVRADLGAMSAGARAAAGDGAGARTSRARRPASARERILAAAVERIASDGIDDVRIARIAMAAGVSSSLVHYHFATREALLAEALEYSYGSRRRRAHRRRAAAGASHAQRLARMVDQCLPSTPELERDWVLWVELWLRAVRHHELRPVAEELYARMRDWFVDGDPRPACATASSRAATPRRSPTARSR